MEDKDFSALALRINCLFSSSDVVTYGAGIIAQLMAGKAEGQQIGPELILFFAILMLIPMLMAFLSLALKDSMNRWANIIVGTIFCVLWLSGAVDAAQSAFWGGALMTLSAVVASVLIIWYAWKSKQIA